MNIYDSMQRKKTPFEPVRPGHVHIYACGMTVYDDCHIGHARAMVVFDMVVRYFRQRGDTVTYVRNITDVDDKIIQRAQANGESCVDLTARTIASMHRDTAALGLAPPDHEPRATAYIPQMITLIEQLMTGGYAYVAASGDVYFRVRRFADYGKLSQRSVDELSAGVRVSAREDKEDPCDFVLWKKEKPGEPSWESPWGLGRPGWHIECSAMATDLLGQPFDIHGGGMDLKFPHHENEIAQSEAVCPRAFANTWMHVGLLQVNGDKMSKSLGNFVTIQDALSQYDAELLRYFMLSGHYRQPINFSETTLQQLQHSLDRLYTALRGLTLDMASPPGGEAYSAAFHAAMTDDFNTPLAFSVLFDLARHISRLKSQGDVAGASQYAALLKALGASVLILQQDPEQYFQGAGDTDDVAQIDALVAARSAAREARDWQRADEIRDALAAMGVTIEDTAEGAQWRRDV